MRSCNSRYTLDCRIEMALEISHVIEAFCAEDNRTLGEEAHVGALAQCAFVANLRDIHDETSIKYASKRTETPSAATVVSNRGGISAT